MTLNTTGQGLSIERIREIAQKTLEERLFPGCSIGIIKADGSNYGQFTTDVIHIGKHTYEQQSPNTSQNSVYDIASLTKAILGTYACHLASKKRLSLLDNIRDYLPEFIGKYTENVTIQDLLTFTIQLNITEELHKHTPKEIWNMIHTRGLVYASNTKFSYKNTTSLLLGKIVEEVTKLPLDISLEKNLFTPLQMKDTTFHPKKMFQQSVIVPTEYDLKWRKKLLHGEIHDELAYSLYPQPVGCAGLFSTMDDLLIFGKMILRSGKINNDEYISTQIFEQIIKNQIPHTNNTYGLGWDKLSTKYSSCTCFNKRAIIITGYTGCSMMFDGEKSTGIIILSNAVHPTRNPGSLSEFRKRIVEEVIYCKHCHE